MTVIHTEIRHSWVTLDVHFYCMRVLENSNVRGVRKNKERKDKTKDEPPSRYASLAYKKEHT